MPDAETRNAATPEQPPLPTGREILRMGLFNYVMQRWAPKNPAARLAVELGS